MILMFGHSGPVVSASTALQAAHEVKRLMCVDFKRGRPSQQTRCGLHSATTVKYYTFKRLSGLNCWTCVISGEAEPSNRPDVAHILPQQSSGIRIAAAWAVGDYSAASEPESSQTSRGDLQGAESLRRGGMDPVASRRGSMDPGSGAFGAALAAAVRKASPARKTARSLSYVSQQMLFLEHGC